MSRYARIDLRSEPSEEDDGGFVVHKALTGSGKYYCFQTVDVTLHFDRQKKTVVSSDVAGGQLITAEEYPALLTQWHEEQARRGRTGQLIHPEIHLVIQRSHRP